MLLATLQLIADATAASPAAGGSSIDAATVGAIIAGVVVSLGAGAGGVAIGRRTHISNSPLDCREVKDTISREEHDKDIDALHNLFRASEEKIHNLLRASEEKIHDLIRASEEKTNRLLRDSETKAHERMDSIAQALNQLIGHVKGIRDSLSPRNPRT